MKRRLLLIKPAHIVDGKQRTGPAQLPISLFQMGYVTHLAPSNRTPNLVGITALIPAAPRADALTRRYPREQAHVVLEAPHVSTLRNEAAQYGDTTGDADRFQLELVHPTSSKDIPATGRERDESPVDSAQDAAIILQEWSTIGRSVMTGGDTNHPYRSGAGVTAGRV